MVARTVACSYLIPYRFGSSTPQSEAEPVGRGNEGEQCTLETLYTTGNSLEEPGFLPIDLRHPFLFYIGHLAAFAWNKAAPLLRLEPFRPEFDVLFERGIDPDVDDPAKCHDHPDVPDAWPAVEQILAYRDRVRAAILACGKERVTSALDGPDGILDMLLEHDLMHIETLYYMLAQYERERKPYVDARAPAPRVGADTQEWNFVHIPTGAAALGRTRPSDGLDAQAKRQFGWDNEFGDESGLVVHVHDFRVAQHPVTVRQFAAFIASGGYKDANLWRDADWQWRKKQGVEYPASWRQKADFGSGRYESTPSSLDQILKGFELVGALHRSRDLEAFQDVPVFCSLAEARAFAKWKQCRLPTEGEWQRMAYGRRADASKVDALAVWQRTREDASATPGVHGNFGFHCTLPCPVGSFPAGDSDFGVSGLIGDGWELTDSEFMPLRGFSPSPHYPNYSADFFDGKHFVLKGASWATDAKLVRPSFRNWYQFNYPFVFAKFRLVMDKVHVHEDATS
ncbi:Ergothioneine biosynthesis protein 1 [Porphyridium purpureum]|uniref:Ergothioneine biosynthesis protein 1 n=1 Tax=Porphyridium purpureum TaxID=35688 RepID=A0A5J4Z3V7_PORPP|nr:Ergothioneine biosynthesis protein 1 [Porphyridium purpureum]|eukprot:POR2067..scf295_1